MIKMSFSIRLVQIMKYMGIQLRNAWRVYRQARTREVLASVILSSTKLQRSKMVLKSSTICFLRLAICSWVIWFLE